MLAPFWSRQLEKNHLMALQLSTRGGELELEVLWGSSDDCSTTRDSSVLVSGQCTLISSGELLADLL